METFADSELNNALLAEYFPEDKVSLVCRIFGRQEVVDLLNNCPLTERPWIARHLLWESERTANYPLIQFCKWAAQARQSYAQVKHALGILEKHLDSHVGGAMVSGFGPTGPDGGGPIISGPGPTGGPTGPSDPMASAGQMVSITSGPMNVLSDVGSYFLSSQTGVVDPRILSAGIEGGVNLELGDPMASAGQINHILSFSSGPMNLVSDFRPNFLSSQIGAIIDPWVLPAGIGGGVNLGPYGDPMASAFSSVPDVGPLFLSSQIGLGIFGPAHVSGVEQLPLTLPVPALPSVPSSVTIAAEEDEAIAAEEDEAIAAEEDEAIAGKRQKLFHHFHQG